MTHRPTLRPLALLLSLACLGAATAHAEDLMDAYRQARQSDPLLQQSEAQRRAISENVNQSWAVLLPQINVQGNFSDSHGTSTSNQPVNSGNGFQVFATRSSSSSRNFNKSANLDQTIFDLGKFASVRAARAQRASGDANYQAAEQDLILRTATAYFNVLTAEDELRFALSSLDDLEREQRDGNLSAEKFDRLHAEYTVRAADAARRHHREYSLRPKLLPQRGRTRAAIAIVAVMAAAGTAMLLVDGSESRAPGETITGNSVAQPSGTADLHAAAQAAMGSGDLAAALKSYLAAIDIDPQDVEALTYAGWISYLGGVPDKAIPFLNAAVQADPQYPDAHAFRGIVLYKAAHDPTRAAAELRAYLRLVPDGQMSSQVRAVLNEVQRR